ncbi:phosphopantothenoylcysteine decarboxylase domain-containing protein, partial [Ileibacterium valens]
TQNLDENAREKLEKKNCDLLIANNLSTKGAGFQTDTNIVSLLKKDSIEHLPKMDKKELGKRILEEMLAIKKGEK